MAMMGRILPLIYRTSYTFKRLQAVLNYYYYYYYYTFKLPEKIATFKLLTNYKILKFVGFVLW